MSLPRLVLSGILFVLWQGVCVCSLASDDTAAAKAGLALEDKEFAELLRESAALENSDAEQSHAKAEQALALARRKKKPTEEDAALYQLGHTLSTQGVYPEAMTVARQGLSLATTLKDEKQRGEFYRLISRLFWFTSDLPDAAANATESLHIARAIGDKSMEQRAEEILGLIYSDQDEVDPARQHLLAALRLGEANHSPDLALELNNLGNLDFEQHDYEAAKDSYLKALALVRQKDDLDVLPTLLNNLGEIASRDGDQVTAASCLDESLSLAKQSGDEKDIAITLCTLAGMNRRQGRLDQAQSFLQQSLAVAQSPKCVSVLTNIYDEFVEQAKARGDYKEAFEYAGKLDEQNELVRGEKSKRKVADVQRRYEQQAHTREVEMLQRDKELQRAELALKKTELSRVATQRFALLAVMICVGVAVAALIGRQRARAKITQQALVETRVAKAQVEEADAHKAQLLAIAAHELQESEARFRSAFECSALGMSLSQLDGRWLRVNEALSRITGYTAAEMPEMSALDITHPDDLAENQRLLDQLIRGEIESYHLEKRIFHRNGQILWTLVDVAVIREPGQPQPRYVISQFQNITHRKRADEQLRLAKEEAEKANAAKSLFLSRISHELRTPLNAILGFGQLLELSGLEDAEAASVKYILQGGRHLLSLVDEVLDLSRAESGELRLVPSRVNVGALAQECLDLMARLAQAREISCRVEAPCFSSVLWCDESRLRQMLLNLISNAIKYNREQGQVVVACEARPDGCFRLNVRDTGSGLSPGEIDQLFVPFERLTQAYGAVEGTGLGLVVSRRVAEAMGGSVGLESEVGRGSTFWIELPGTAVQEAAATSPASGDEPPVQTVPAPGSVRLLYIEDDASNIQVMRFLLAKCRPQWKLLSAVNGAAGLESARRDAPDLILLDLQLPGLPGDRVLAELRRDPQTKRIPVIVLSADATLHSRERLLAEGASEYITKPFQIERLLTQINEFLAMIAR